MRNYWLKIVFGAFGVFLVGFTLVSLFRHAKHSVVSTFESTDPISLPIPFLDFRLDGRKLGEISRVVLLRNDPQHIAGVTVVLSLADSLRDGLTQCLLTVDNVDQMNDKSTFRCQTAADTAGQTLVPFGKIAFKGGSEDTLPLLMPAKAVEDIQRISFRLNSNGVSVDQEPDSLQEVRDSIHEAILDSLNDLAEHRSDSLQHAAEHLADSLADAAMRKSGGTSVKVQAGSKRGATAVQVSPPKPPARPAAKATPAPTTP